MSDDGQPDEPSGEELLAQAAEAGIHRLAIPTPFQVGRVNAYLIEDSPLTLIDSGPNSGKALDELEQALAARGHAIEDIELLVVTHQHIDHFGLASILARRSGARGRGAGRARALPARLRRQPPSWTTASPRRSCSGTASPPMSSPRCGRSRASFRAWGSAVEITRPLRDGEELRLRDRTLRVLHRPGHSPSDTVFLETDRVAVRDPARRRPSDRRTSPPTRCSRVPSTPSPDFTGPRPRALIDYIASLKRTRAMDLSLVLPGHGMPIADHASLIDERFRMHRRRAERIHGLIAAQPRTAHEIAERAVGQRRRHPGLPDDLRGARPRRSAARRRPRRRTHEADEVVRFEAV